MLGTKLKQYRTEHDLRASHLAQEWGVSPTYISLIESGVKFPSAATARNIAKLLGITLEEIYEMIPTTDGHRMPDLATVKQMAEQTGKTMDDVYDMLSPDTAVIDATPTPRPTVKA